MMATSNISKRNRSSSSSATSTPPRPAKVRVGHTSRERRVHQQGATVQSDNLNDPSEADETIPAESLLGMTEELEKARFESNWLRAYIIMWKFAGMLHAPELAGDIFAATVNRIFATHADANTVDISIPDLLWATKHLLTHGDTNRSIVLEFAPPSAECLAPLLHSIENIDNPVHEKTEDMVESESQAGEEVEEEMYGSEGEEGSLEDRVKRLEGTVDELDQENKELHANISNLLVENKETADKLREIELQLYMLQAEVRMRHT